jgi:hypothetical protein
MEWVTVAFILLLNFFCHKHTIRKILQPMGAKGWRLHYLLANAKQENIADH